VLRKRLSVEKGQMVLFEEYRYFFYLTNDRTTPASDVVFLANERCDQENLIAQLKAGSRRWRCRWRPVSNWAYMVMASLAWSPKAWRRCCCPRRSVAEKHHAEKRSLLRMSSARSAWR